MIILTHSEAETEKFACNWSATLIPGDVIALFGELGAGKTAFVRGLARGLGHTEPVTSPTYTLVNVYEGENPLVHFDLYRINGPEALDELGWYDVNNGKNIVCVEWSERIESELPENCKRVYMSYGKTKDDRRIEIPLNPQVK